MPTMKAEGAFRIADRRLEIGHSLIVFGESLQEIQTWIQNNGSEKIVFDGSYLHLYSGKYEKAGYGKTEKHDPLSVRHQGWGKGTIGIPGITWVYKRLAKATHAVVGRYYVAAHVSKARTAPKRVTFMHGQKSCTHRLTITGDTAQLRGGIQLSQMAPACQPG